SGPAHVDAAASNAHLERVRAAAIGSLRFDGGDVIASALGDDTVEGGAIAGAEIDQRPASDGEQLLDPFDRVIRAADADAGHVLAPHLAGGHDVDGRDEIELRARP